MIQRARCTSSLIESCDVKPLIAELEHQSYGQVRNVSALLDELFLVLYEPKERARLKVPQLHYCQQVPMRLRHLPKSFFVPSHTQSNQNLSMTNKNRLKHLVPPAAHQQPQHFDYCFQSKALQTPPTNSIVPTTDSKNIVISSNNRHISFIEGHQYDARMYASIEVTATTLKYQKTLQLPPTQSTSTQFKTHSGTFAPAANTANHWESTNYPMYQTNQSNSWLNYPRQLQPSQYESSESSEAEIEQSNDMSKNVHQTTNCTTDYLDLDGIDNSIDVGHSNEDSYSNSLHQNSTPYASATNTIHDQSLLPYSAMQTPVPAHQPIDHILAKEPSDLSISATSYDQSHQLTQFVQPAAYNTSVLTQFSPNAPNLWNPNWS